MSLTSKQIDDLRAYAKDRKGELAKLINDAADTIEMLSAKQPEIVRCKDCKNYGAILFRDTQFEHGECFGHDDSNYTFDISPDDFCSRAERRTDEKT